MLIVNDNELSCRKNLISVNHKQIVGIFRDTVIRNKGNSQSDFSKVDQKIIAAELDLRDEIQLMFLEKTV